MFLVIVTFIFVMFVLITASVTADRDEYEDRKEIDRQCRELSRRRKEQKAKRRAEIKAREKAQRQKRKRRRKKSCRRKDKPVFRNASYPRRYD